MGALLSCVVLLGCLIGQSQAYEMAEAKFKKEAKGSVQFVNGFVTGSIDMSDFEWGTDGVPDRDVCEYIYYHIHQNWEPEEEKKRDENDDRRGNQCGPDYTGGHFDPWKACGPKAHNDGQQSSDCIKDDGCLGASSALYYETLDNTDSPQDWTYACNGTDLYFGHPHSCELGDTSGKYGRIAVEDSDDFMIEFENFGFYEFHGSALRGRSIVFHCGGENLEGKPRILCAPFEIELDGDDEEIIEKYGDKFMEKKVGESFAEVDFSDVEMDGVDFDGFKVRVGLGWHEMELPASVGAVCSQWELQLFDSWPESGEEEGSDPPQWMLNGQCENDKDGNLGGMWDPTHQCHRLSSSPHCSQISTLLTNEEVRCEGTSDTTFDYECWNTNPEQSERSAMDSLMCTVGDVGNRAGYFFYDKEEGGDQTIKIFDAWPPAIPRLKGRSVLLRCQEQESDEVDLSRVCAQIGSVRVSDDDEERQTESKNKGSSGNGKLGGQSGEAGLYVGLILLPVLILIVGTAILYRRYRKKSKLTENLIHSVPKPRPSSKPKKGLPVGIAAMAAGAGAGSPRTTPNNVKPSRDSDDDDDVPVVDSDHILEDAGPEGPPPSHEKMDEFFHKIEERVAH